LSKLKDGLPYTSRSIRPKCVYPMAKSDELLARISLPQSLFFHIKDYKL
jgi:hypothetical protein